MALIMAVVAMCTRQVNRGLILLLSSFVGMGASALLSIFLAVGMFAAAVAPAVEKSRREMEKADANARESQRTLLLSQQRVIDSMNHALSATQRVQPISSAPLAPVLSVESWNSRELFEEIARVEKQKRDMEKAGHLVPEAVREYLIRLQTALDRS